MAAGYVQVFITGENQDNAATANPFTVTANTTAGNRAAVLAYNEDAMPTAVSDSKGNTWSKIFDLPTATALNATVWTAHLTSALTTSDTVTVTKANATDRPTALAGVELSSIASSSAVDRTQTNSGTGVTACSTGTTLATTQADEIALAFWVNNSLLAWSNQTNSFTEVVDFGTIAGGSGGGKLCIAYKVLAATATQECSADRAAGGGVNWTSGIATLLGAGGAAATSLLVRRRPERGLVMRSR